MKPTDLRGILQYIPRFRDRPFVIAVDGAAVTDENFPNILLDIAVLRSLNIHVVLVHGASAYIERLATEQSIGVSDLEGAGVTDEPTLRLALTAANRLTHEILEGLSASDLRAACTNAITAYPLGILQGVDHLHTGKVEKVDVPVFHTLLGSGIIPVVPPLGFDGEGRTYRVNSDAVAVALAKALTAAKLIYITPRDGLYLNGDLIRQMLAADLESLLARPASTVDSISKAQHAVAACNAGVPRVHIINGRVFEGLLAEVFSNEGIGTLIYANQYQQIRRALKKDARNIFRLTKNLAAADELVRRTRASIERNIDDYHLFEIDRNPVACISFHPYPEHKSAELACLAVSPSHENQGIGRKLVQYIEVKTREAGLDSLFALSTQTFTYFQSKTGFREGTAEDLPPPRREKYEQSGRRAKVLVKRLR